MLIAVDTNVLIDQALCDADVLDAIGIIQERLRDARFIVTPTVLQELAWLVDNGDGTMEKNAANDALSCLLKWRYEPLNVIPVGHGIVEQISFKLRSRGIIPEEEENDAAIVAEAALIGCQILLSSDAHLVFAQECPEFRKLLKDCDVDGDEMVIARPRIVVDKFFRRSTLKTRSGRLGM